MTKIRKGDHLLTLDGFRVAATSDERHIAGGHVVDVVRVEDVDVPTGRLSTGDLHPAYKTGFRWTAPTHSFTRDESSNPVDVAKALGDELAAATREVDAALAAMRKFRGAGGFRGLAERLEDPRLPALREAVRVAELRRGRALDALEAFDNGLGDDGRGSD